MKLTERDRKLLSDIQQYGILPTKLVASRHFDGVALSTVLRRLRLLKDSRYVQRILVPDNTGYAWSVTDRAAEELNGGPAKTSFPSAIVNHDLLLMQLRMRLEECGIAQIWIPEHVIRKRMAQAYRSRDFKLANIPDGLMGIVSKKLNKLTYAIELELTAKSQKRYREIFRQYEERNHLQVVWYVVGKATIGRQLMNAARQGSHRFMNSPPYLKWSLLDDVLSDPWRALVHDHNSKMPLADLLMLPPNSAQHPAQRVSS